MRPEYDFSKAERGKFFREGAITRLPIYLDPELQRQLEEIAERRGTDIELLVSRILMQEIGRSGSDTT